MFDGDLGKRAVKGAISAEPFIDDDAKGILVAGRAGMRLHLFWDHVGNGSGGLLLATTHIRVTILIRETIPLRATTRVAPTEGLVYYCDAEVTKQNLVSASQQHILRFDVT